MDKAKKTFEVGGVTYAVRLPTLDDHRVADAVKNKRFATALQDGSILRARLNDVLTRQGLWDDQKEMEYKTLKKQILDAEVALKKGGIKLSSAKSIALDLVKYRNELRNLISERSQLDSNTVEGQADNDRFNSLVSSCVVYNDSGKPYFANLGDYLNKSSDPVGQIGANELMALLYGVDSNSEEKLPEYEFLKKYKFVDEKLRLINKDGHLVDTDGRLVDENGRYVNAQGAFVDKEGNPVNEAGDYAFVEQPFLDDDGQPVVVEVAAESDIVSETV